MIKNLKQLKGDYSSYYITDTGEVFRKVRIFSGRIYDCCSLSSNNKRKTFNIHRLVAETFIPNPDNKPEVNHINTNKKDNRASNLEWSTRKENMRHAKENGLCPTGTNNGNGKLNDYQKRVIKANFKLKKPVKGVVLSEFFDISETRISALKYDNSIK
jgi:hypothetical protein